jgi:hypothetical protein
MNMKILTPPLILIGCLAIVCTAQAADVAAMVRQAITQGHASGYVDGPIAEQTRLKLNATGPLNLEVKKIYDFEQPDCARVQLNFLQSDALLPSATMPKDYSWATQMNICSDGQPPVITKRKAQ